MSRKIVKREISLKETLKALSFLRNEQVIEATLFCIGPMSENIVQATLELARDEDFPAIFIASRNQVDAKELGGGYVLDWDQMKFVETINTIADRVKFQGILFICRDHGGPWQRDNERREKLLEKDAMEKAKVSYLADLVSRFKVLHIDPTVDPHIEGYVSLDIVIRRTVELIEYIEEERVKRGIKPISYEIGTEETAGGLIEPGVFGKFLVDILDELNNRHLPHPDFIVGQTGTLIRMKRNAGHFNAEKTKELAAIAKQHGVGFKGHNADFLDRETLHLHPNLGITGANTGPEFSVAETESYIKLGEMEEKAVKEGKLDKSSHFIPAIEKAALKCGRWKKWLSKEEEQLTEDEILHNQSKLSEITSVAGRYVFDHDDVKKARKQLFKNLKSLKIIDNPEREIIEAIKKSIKEWVKAFNLKGVSSKILAKIQTNMKGA